MRKTSRDSATARRSARVQPSLRSAPIVGLTRASQTAASQEARGQASAWIRRGAQTNIHGKTDSTPARTSLLRVKSWFDSMRTIKSGWTRAKPMTFDTVSSSFEVPARCGPRLHRHPRPRPCATGNFGARTCDLRVRRTRSAQPRCRTLTCHVVCMAICHTAQLACTGRGSVLVQGPGRTQPRTPGRRIVVCLVIGASRIHGLFRSPPDLGHLRARPA